MFFLLHRHTDDAVFDYFPKISDYFSKICVHSPKFVLRSQNVAEHFMYRSNRSFNIPPGIPRAFDVFSCPGGRESLPGGGHLITTHALGVENLIASLDFMLRVALIPPGVINYGERQAFMHSKRKIPDSWRTG